MATLSAKVFAPRANRPVGQTLLLGAVVIGWDNHACRRYSLRRHRMVVAGRARGAALTARRIPLIPYAALLRFFGGAMRVGGAPSSKEAALSQTCASCM